jgi:hypothetical protein
MGTTGPTSGSRGPCQERKVGRGLWFGKTVCWEVRRAVAFARERLTAVTDDADVAENSRGSLLGSSRFPTATSPDDAVGYGRSGRHRPRRRHSSPGDIPSGCSQRSSMGRREEPRRTRRDPRCARVSGRRRHPRHPRSNAVHPKRRAVPPFNPYYILHLQPSTRRQVSNGLRRTDGTAPASRRRPAPAAPSSLSPSAQSSRDL